MAFDIRKMEVKDAASIIEHKKKVTEENPDTLATAIENKTITIEEEEATVKSLGPNDLGIVAVDGDKVVGMLNMRQDHRKKFEHIGQFGISMQQAYTGSGTGTEMVKQAIQFARDNDMLEKIILTVFSNNPGAIKLYKKLGFEEEATLKNQVKLAQGYTDLVYMSIDVK
ncbi:putative acetyltransferase YhhY [Jeotgalicoccus aerolatus]|jgi:RimJ/RimL family protein N-acetyltransferase|uniref:RimJ/RimL family protein N-acetyltransferase n=1 Tax=Jeotgalicoccus aerolatus TaxID=709510 RepID=A0ABS4HML5_9STAP|nr:GNAT family protein [Jeotgalicoccus aerolatus]MBP1952162.1 RimJ/RimL family protein N-acetyltransferase [Jeotgalicoccus aerolatus]GGE06380.1 N-acetyltransferase [Jeotgalicoccus aerolatus]CAD2070753.1 putative acetyltransferase YhhY [Jeotgalicoccus aerolatus]